MLGWFFCAFALGLHSFYILPHRIDDSSTDNISSTSLSRFGSAQSFPSPLRLAGLWYGAFSDKLDGPQQEMRPAEGKGNIENTHLAW